MLRIGTSRSSQISLTQGMSSNKEALSNSIAFMNSPQDGKGMLFIFAEKEWKKKKGNPMLSGTLILEGKQA